MTFRYPLLGALMALPASCGGDLPLEPGAYNVYLNAWATACPPTHSVLGLDGPARWVVSVLEDEAWLLEEPATRFLALGGEVGDAVAFDAVTIDYTATGGRLETHYSAVLSGGARLAGRLEVHDGLRGCVLTFDVAGHP